MQEWHLDFPGLKIETWGTQQWWGIKKGRSPVCCMQCLHAMP
jgi:hypothetical protein